ncbi:MAG: hypothetical protein IT424_14105 [Pirellulales bacterium]|nr:hypothetical protein [Pirellulales bacterium]
MNLNKTALAVLLALSCLAATGNSAHAQCGYGAGFYGGFWDIGRLYGVLADEVPYYAAFPPVYYSYPVARTYGYSPFAYPPGVMTPDIDVVEPAVIENPYFNGEQVPQPGSDETSGSAPPVDQTTSAARRGAPLVIINRHVQGASTSISAAPASFAQR